MMDEELITVEGALPNEAVKVRPVRARGDPQAPVAGAVSTTTDRQTDKTGQTVVNVNGRKGGGRCGKGLGERERNGQWSGIRVVAGWNSWMDGQRKRVTCRDEVSCPVPPRGSRGWGGLALAAWQPRTQSASPASPAQASLPCRQ